MGLGPILEHHNAFQWDLSADAYATAQVGITLTKEKPLPVTVTDGQCDFKVKSAGFHPFNR